MDKLKDVLKKFDLMPKKQFGQNFILDMNLLRKIVGSANLTENDQVIEIGPGPGGLTRAILESSAKVTAFEIDPRCVQALKDLQESVSNHQLEVIEQDALKINISNYIDCPKNSSVKVVANLPYHISSQLLIQWVKQIQHIQLMVLMFQKEMADRIIADPNSKTYGRLSIVAQAFYRIEKQFDISPKAFYPPPKIYSTVLRFMPLNDSADRLEFLPELERLTQMAFHQRRKMLRSSLKSLGPSFFEKLQQMGVNETVRAENLTVEQYVELAKFLKKNNL